MVGEPAGHPVHRHNLAPDSSSYGTRVPEPSNWDWNFPFFHQARFPGTPPSQSSHFPTPPDCISYPQLPTVSLVKTPFPYVHVVIGTTLTHKFDWL